MLLKQGIIPVHTVGNCHQEATSGLLYHCLREESSDTLFGSGSSSHLNNRTTLFVLQYCMLLFILCTYYFRFKRVLPLPSESWQEMCGNVFCHGDANFAADTLAPKVDDCFISKMDYVLHSSVLKNNKVKYGSRVDYEIFQGLYRTYCPSNCPQIINRYMSL